MNRLYEVARKLGMRNMEVQEALTDLGYPVRSAATPVTDEELQALLAKIGITPTGLDQTGEPDTNE